MYPLAYSSYRATLRVSGDRLDELFALIRARDWGFALFGTFE